MSQEFREQKLKVRELFYSLQGEGGRAGEASIFIRLAHCNKDCWFCDTDWSWGLDVSIADIEEEIKQYPAKWIVWTGGEPTLQLSSAIVAYFNQLGYKQAIETNGTNQPPDGLEYIVCSPKVNSSRLQVSFHRHKVNEYRYPFGETDIQPPDIKELPPADYYYVSPLFLGEEKKRFELDDATLQKCIEFVKLHPEWRLSVQQHKLWRIL